MTDDYGPPCPCCKWTLGCYCYEYPHTDNPACPGNYDDDAPLMLAIKAGERRAKEMSDHLRDACRLDPRVLDIPFSEAA